MFFPTVTSFINWSAYWYRMGEMKPIGLPPALNLAAFTSESTPPAIGADTDVPAAAKRPPPAINNMLEPAADMSG